MIRKGQKIKDDQIGFKCSLELKKQLEQLALLEKTNLTDVVLRILENGIEAEQERADKIKQILNN